MTKPVRQGIFFRRENKTWRMIRSAGRQREITMPPAESIDHTYPPWLKARFSGKGKLSQRQTGRFAGKGKDEKRKVFL